MDIVDELANELRRYRHGDVASGKLAEHILAIPRIHDALEAHSVIAGKVAELTGLLDDMQQAEAEYRLMHDRHGDGSQAAGRAWDLMRRAGDKARAALAPYPERR